MAKIVIAGSSDCPHFARVELLADWLEKNLPAFKLTKVVKQPKDWQSWSKRCCQQRGWRQLPSPIIWRELVNQGGKGVLIGGANEFQEFAKAYYDYESCMTSEEMQSVANDNARYRSELDAEEAELRARSKPLRVLLTGAAGSTAYQLLPMLIDGSVFGSGVELSIVLYDASAEDLQLMQGVAMECVDMSQRLLSQIEVSNSFNKSIARADVLIILDEILLESSAMELEQQQQQQQKEEQQRQQKKKRQQEKGSENEEEAAAAAEAAAAEAAAARVKWLQANADLITAYAEAIGQHCQRPEALRVAIAGRGPTNFCTRVLLNNCQQLSKRNVLSFPTLLERQVKGLLAAHMRVTAADVEDVLIWGDAAAKVQFVDLSAASVRRYNGAVTGSDVYRQLVTDTIWDKKWLEGELPKQIKQRVASNVSGLAGRFALSSAQSLADSLRLWWCGSAHSYVTCVGLVSEGWYGVPKDLVCNFPVRFQPRGTWCVVQDFDLSEASEQQLAEAVEASQQDYESIYPPPEPPVSNEPEPQQSDEIELNDDDNDDKEEGEEGASRVGVDFSLEKLKARIAAESVEPLAANTLMQISPQLAAELLAIDDSEEFTSRLEQLRETGDKLGAVAEDHDPVISNAERVEQNKGGDEVDNDDSDVDSDDDSDEY